ncbi:mitochondrial assembly of ribosomal large subunit protein 1 [Narcine bancroftii]|uniref:mitochondrial assembly of ribosomal large subunit protein 1 n=1 Tax=Narcine bancroftii TaxID=1343680 RepID=UPI003831ADFA
MGKVVATLAALAGCGVRTVLRAAREPAQRALLCPDGRAKPARGPRGPGLIVRASRGCSGEHWERSPLEERGSINEPVLNIDVLVALLRQENAKDICVIKLPVEIKYADYFIIVTGTSTRHLQAMAQYAVKVHKHLKRGETDHVHIEGKETDDWKCIDFGNIVVHFMLPEAREIYELEKLWTLRSYDDQFVKIPLEILPLDFIYTPTTDLEQK